MRSEELFNESKKFLPGGVDSPVRAYKPYPFFAEYAKGSKIVDVDGKSYIRLLPCLWSNGTWSCKS